MRKQVLALVAVAGLAASFAFSSSAHAAPIGTSNSVVLVRVGDGETTLAGTAIDVFIEEYSISYTSGAPTGATHVQTITVPTTGATGERLTIGGTSALEGGLNFSTNGQYLMFAGYDSAVGAAASGGNTNRRMIGRLDMNGNLSFDALYGTGTISANNAIRTVASVDGSAYWFGMSASPGIGYRTWAGGNDSTVLSTSLNNTNTRRLEIYNGQLYVSSAAGSLFGVATVGTGTPTTAGQTVTVLPGMPTTTGPSTYDFFFADSNTVYLADDRTNTSGGLQKWTFDGTNWSLAYTLNINPQGASLANGIRGLTGSVDDDGLVTLFATTTFSGTAPNFLVGISDTLSNTNAGNVTVNSLVAAGANTTFRGLEAIGIAVPEPAGLALLALGGVGLLARRRR